MPDKTNEFQKFLFKANATALSGSVRKPYYQHLGEQLAISTYAGSAGRVRSESDGFALGDQVSYSEASTEIVAEVKRTICRTTVTARIKNLSIGRLLTADEIVCQLQAVYDARNYPTRIVSRILPAGSNIKNLRFDKKPLDLKFPPAFTLNKKSQDEFFAGQHDDDPAYHPGYVPDSIPIQGFGTIFFAEWTWVHPGETHRQRLTMLRLALGSDFGAELDVCAGDSNGTGWPPY